MGGDDLLVLLGGFAGGYVSGLTGFGTGLAALPFWLNALPPVVAAPLVVICSITAQLLTLPAIRHALDWQRVFPFVLGGLAGVPLGTLLLAQVSPLWFKLLAGLLLIAYCSFMLAARSAPVVSAGGRLADGVIGVGGGILGGLAGLSGPLPTIWAGLRGWNRDQKRGVFQAFNLTILAFAFAAQAFGGLITVEVGQFVLVALPGTLAGAWLGRRTYNRVGDRRFDRLVLVLLLFAGISLVAGVVLGA